MGVRGRVRGRLGWLRISLMASSLLILARKMRFTANQRTLHFLGEICNFERIPFGGSGLEAPILVFVWFCRSLSKSKFGSSDSDFTGHGLDFAVALLPAMGATMDGISETKC